MDSDNPYLSPKTEFTATSLPVDDNPFRIYWTMASVPELAVLPKDERRPFWHKHWSGALRHWQTRLAMVAGFCCALLPFTLYCIMGSPEPLTIPFIVFSSAGAGVGGLFYGVVCLWMAWPYLRRGLDERLKEQAAEIAERGRLF